MKVGVIVLNWNNSPDTLRCLESVLALQHREIFLYVVDNGSSDSSASRIRDWLSDRQPSEASRRTSSSPSTDTRDAAGMSVELVELDRNLGYAAGNNAGIRRALAAGCDAVWILNNDTIVAADSLSALVEMAESVDRIGIIGACILEDDAPTVVQCLGGGKYNWALSKVDLVAAGADVARPGPWLDARPDFIAGSCMFVLRSTLERVGLLAEEFFLYGEEIDFTERCRRAGLGITVCAAARVWHKYGATTGASRRSAAKSRLVAFYGTRSAIRLTLKYRPQYLPSVVVLRVGYALVLAVQRRYRLAASVARGILSGLSMRATPP